jgi:hypothetical protein
MTHPVYGRITFARILFYDKCKCDLCQKIVREMKKVLEDNKGQAAYSQQPERLNPEAILMETLQNRIKLDNLIVRAQLSSFGCDSLNSTVT